MRTVKFLGYAFGATPASIVAKVDGTQVFSGDVITAPLTEMLQFPTTDLPPEVTLFSIETAIDSESTVAVEVEVTSGIVVFTNHVANYFVDKTLHTLSGADRFKGWGTDPRSNLTIDGVLQTVNSLDDNGNPSGSHFWTLDEGSTIAYDLFISAGVE